MLFNSQHITSLFENATEGMVVSDAGGKIILANPSACRMFGYTVDELFEQEIEILIPKTARAGHIGLRHGFYADPRNRVMGHGRDLHGERKDGYNFPVEVSLSTYIRDGERFVIAFIIDITARKQIESDLLQQRDQLEKITAEIRTLNSELENKVTQRTVILNEALQRLEASQLDLSEALGKERQLNEIKSRFVAMASHEFRTPLSTVLSSASLAEKYTTGEDQEKRARHLEKIRTSVRHLNSMLDDFLSLGRIEEGKVVLRLEQIEIPDLLQEVLTECRNSIVSDQSFLVEHEGNTGFITDENLLRNILLNLISNAIKFSHPSGEIEIRSRVAAHSLEMNITDHGIGITPEDQQQLFSTFFRGKNAANIQGTGLGLHIVKRYADMLGGEISIDSRPGEGTLVVLTIPETRSTDE